MSQVGLPFQNSILEKSGLVKVSTTMPYRWQR